jgi:hypothetical protein
MKILKLQLALGLLLMCSSSLIAQVAPAASKSATYGQFKSVEDVDSYIKAIDSKVAFIQSNPVQDSIAKQNGWYIQMVESRKDAIQQREKLIQEAKKNQQ